MLTDNMNIKDKIFLELNRSIYDLKVILIG